MPVKSSAHCPTVEPSMGSHYQTKFYMNKPGDIVKDTLDRKGARVWKVISIRFKSPALK